MYVDRDKFVNVVETARSVALRMQEDGDAKSVAEHAFLEGVLYANDFMLKVLSGDQLKVIDEEGVRDLDVL